MGMGATPTERVDAADGRMDGRLYGAPIHNAYALFVGVLAVLVAT